MLTCKPTRGLSPTHPHLVSGVKTEVASKRAALVSAYDALSAPTGWTWCMQTLPSGLTASMSVCNPWPTFLPVDVTPLHMPPAPHALKLLWISWAWRKNNFCCQHVNTGVKESLLLLDVVKAVSAAVPPTKRAGFVVNPVYFLCLMRSIIRKYHISGTFNAFHTSIFPCLPPHRQDLDYWQR